MSLGRVLRKRTPRYPSPDLAAAAKQVDAELSNSQKVLIDRIRNHGPAVAMLDREDDGYADTMLRVCRTRVEDWQLFVRPTARRMMAAKPQPDPNDADKQAKAELAARVYGLMFANGFDATRAPYAEQGEYMLMLERIIEEEQLEQPLTELIGEAFYTELRATITLYTAMVERRQSGDPNSDSRLQDRRIALQQAIQNYLIALLAMIRDDDPDNVREIQRALGTTLRQPRAASRGRGDDPGPPRAASQGRGDDPGQPRAASQGRGDDPGQPRAAFWVGGRRGAGDGQSAAQRKPRSAEAWVGANRLRLNTRRLAGDASNRSPPRATFWVPSAGPWGSLVGLTL
jgi:hypothetical protein